MKSLTNWLDVINRDEIISILNYYKLASGEAALWPDQPFEGAALEMRPSVEGEESDHIYQG